MVFDETKLCEIITPLSVICDNCCELKPDQCEHDLGTMISTGVLNADVAYDFIYVDSPSIELLNILYHALDSVKTNGFVIIDDITV